MSTFKNSNEDGIECVSFNQDFSAISVGFQEGFTLFSLAENENLELVHRQPDPDQVMIVERLFSSSLVAIVSRKTPRKLKLCHFKKGTEICSYSYNAPVLSVRLNRQRLVVCLEESVYIHNIRDMRLLHTVRDTPLNPSGLMELSVSPESQSYVAYPGSTTTGELQIFDALNLHATTVISAHNGRLACLSFNARGDMIATASEKGTVVRVFRIPEGDRLFEFRRGMARCVQMSSLRFSLDSQFLVSSSNTETVHIYRLTDIRDNEERTDETWLSYLSQAGSQLLPSSVHGMLTQDRAVAWARLPPTDNGESQPRHYGVLARLREEVCLLVATSSGRLYVYGFDPDVGGECVLKESHELRQLPDNDFRLQRSYAETVSNHQTAVSRDTPPDVSKAFEEPVEPVNNSPASYRLDDPLEFPPMMHDS